MNDRNTRESIEFVVGEEKNLADVVAETEISPLFDGILRAGASRAALTEPDGGTLWSTGHRQTGDEPVLDCALALEGEEVGRLTVEAPAPRKEQLREACNLLSIAVQTIVINNLKRMLTTEIHTTVVNQSYDELLETNRQLARSEQQYRELAENLEIKVAERTRELEKTHARLLQRDKMAAVGQLAAGMAHEINNPLGFITSNLATLGRYITRLRQMIDFCRSDPDLREPARQERFNRKYRELKLDFILGDIDDLMSQNSEGCERIRRIIADLKAFSRVDQCEQIEVDLNEELDRTLGVLARRIPDDANIIKNYGSLPPYTCNAALICQVFLAVIINAVQMKPAGLKLLIDTGYRPEDAIIEICFADNGPGMPPEVADRVFEPFFTTKDVGDGIGLGLATAYDVITSHNGTIEVESTPGKGTEFIINFPTARP